MSAQQIAREVADADGRLSTGVRPWVEEMIVSGIERWESEQYDSNLAKATDIVRGINHARAVQVELKAAFKGDELDGGWRTALTHPLYLAAEQEIADLREQLKGLI